MKNGISIITCSIHKELYDQMINSVSNTIGVENEVISFDNSKLNWNICKAYNYCANKSEYEYLCFIHEDVIISTANWGNILLEFEKATLNCGIIGFAGSKMVNKNLLGWGNSKNGYYRYYDPRTKIEDKKKLITINDLKYKYRNPNGVEFENVITLDGLFLFVKKSIWEEYPFDENNILGFHLYDIDFSLSIAQKYKNFVCFLIDIYHFSSGKKNKQYYENLRIIQKKWKSQLPLIISKEKVNFYTEAYCGVEIIIQSIKNGLSVKESIKYYFSINEKMTLHKYIISILALISVIYTKIVRKFIPIKY